MLQLINVDMNFHDTIFNGYFLFIIYNYHASFLLFILNVSVSYLIEFSDYVNINTEITYITNSGRSEFEKDRAGYIITLLSAELEESPGSMSTNGGNMRLDWDFSI